jgi:hypothetical protein
VLHIRVISPPVRSDAVRELLLAEPGATHVTVLPGVAVQPVGDVVEADVTRESVDGVLSSLRGLGIDRAGGVTLGTIDTTSSDAADAAEQAAPGDPMVSGPPRRATDHTQRGGRLLCEVSGQRDRSYADGVMRKHRRAWTRTCSTCGKFAAGVVAVAV